MSRHMRISQTVFSLGSLTARHRNAILMAFRWWAVSDPLLYDYWVGTYYIAKAISDGLDEPVHPSSIAFAVRSFGTCASSKRRLAPKLHLIDSRVSLK